MHAEYDVTLPGSIAKCRERRLQRDAADKAALNARSLSRGIDDSTKSATNVGKYAHLATPPLKI